MLTPDEMAADELRCHVGVLVETMRWPFHRIANHLGLAGGEFAARLLYAEWVDDRLQRDGAARRWH